MTTRIFHRSFALIAVVAGLWSAPAPAQEPALPGGATSLREVHGDWVVNCIVADQGEAARKICTLSQEQHDGKSGQRIIAMELLPATPTSTATLFLPFGLDLAAGATMQVDEIAQKQQMPFRTCLPAGCVITTNIDAKMLASMRSGTALKIQAKADGGKETIFSISLKGFGGAFDRTASLAK